MTLNIIEFVVANDPDNDFDIMKEAWLNDQLIALVHKVNKKWIVEFFPGDKKYCEVSWEHLNKIYDTFNDFIKESVDGVD